MIDQATRAAETRERILAAAAVEFAEHGYAGASIGTIADKADVGKGLVQYHFRAKSDIAGALIRAVFAHETVTDETGATPLRGIDAIIASIRQDASAYRDDVRVRAAVRLAREHDQIGVPLPTPYAGWIAQISAMLDDAIAMDEVRADLDSEREAYHLVAGFYGVQEISSRLTGRADLLERIEEMLLRSLASLGVADVQRRLSANIGSRPAQYFPHLDTQP